MSSKTYLAAWRDDLRGAAVRGELARASVPSVLLKGSAFRLHFDVLVRQSADCDLLIPAGDEKAAHSALLAAGYRAVMLSGDAPDDGARHADIWRIPGDYFVVDLHRTLPEARVDPSHVWSILLPHVVTETVAGTPTEVLDRPATAALAVLHAAHHAREDVQAWSDLAAVIEQLEIEHWAAAANLAANLDAGDAFVAALSSLEGGKRILDFLDLDEITPDLRTSMRWNAEPWGATALSELLEAEGVRARSRKLTSAVFPPRRTMRYYHPTLARRGPLGLALAYTLRPLRLAARLPNAVRVLRRYRSESHGPPN